MKIELEKLSTFRANLALGAVSWIVLNENDISSLKALLSDNPDIDEIIIEFDDCGDITNIS